MKSNKVHTTRKTGNYVRYFLFTVVLAVSILACDKLDTMNDDPRDNLVGVWYCSELSSTNTQNYQVTIAKSSVDTLGILISNFNLLGKDIDIQANLNGRNITIPSQTVSGFSISGSGSVTSDYKTINLTYSVNTGSEIEHWTAVYSK